MSDIIVKTKTPQHAYFEKDGHATVQIKAQKSNHIVVLHGFSESEFEHLSKVSTPSKEDLKASKGFLSFFTDLMR